ncbi:unnamed protein product [Clonostachys byssicola]|uniref:C2H2-type domain-containing protein n=1 Tax=Clonostachys byssicola TaxID=160290 RepID=A0A9N9UTJ1_9HYPO|nr:unnamed protein product [Clonostachys byssicola]
MLPIQSLNGGAPRPQGAQSAPLSAPDGGEPRQQKPKTLPCKYCNKRFRRVEHVQRHERTHTKEKPFQCTWDRCGKTFGRRDLLVRHEKLVHLNDNNKDNARPRKLSSNLAQQPSIINGHGEGGAMGVIRPVRQQPLSPQSQQPALSHPQHHQNLRPEKPAQHFHHPNHVSSISSGSLSDGQRGSRSDACNLAMLSDAALASEVNPMQPGIGDASQQPPAHDRPKSFSSSSGPYDERPREDSQAIASAYMPSPPQGSSDDYNLFLDDFAPTPHLLPPPYDLYQRTGSWSRASAANGPRGSGSRPSQAPGGASSGGQDSREQSDHSSRNEDSRVLSLQVSVVDHNTIKNRLDGFSSVLPNDFVFPSRHTLTRFLEGYISGFHEHLPFLHLPTLSPAEMAPELLLAILAVGAQHRFESNRGYALWYASKAVAMEQIRRRHSSEVHALLPTAAAYSPHSTRPSPNSTYRHSFASAQSERPLTQDTHREPYSPNTPQARLETMQAVLLLFAVGLWGAKTILHESLAMQSTLSVLVREDGLGNPNAQGTSNDWETWVRLEGATRTKLVAFCFFNLCSTAYNTPPLLLISELKLSCPQPSLLWRAESAWQWQELRQSNPATESTVHEAFARLFSRSNHAIPLQMSSLGNYVLIHALLQHIYLLKQTSFAAGSPYDVHRTLKPEDAEDVAQALQVWQTSFEQRLQARVTEPGQINGTDSIPGGSLAYNASALFRLAYIRLYTELPPNLGLDSRDALLVASALSGTPLLVRSLRLHRAVFQAVHALSVLVKAGVKYVAHTKSSEWSIQHSLCNFECAILVAKWLLTLSSISRSDPPISPEERNLLDTVQRMLDETEFAVPIDPSLSAMSQSEGLANEVTKLRRLASAVVRLWAETFKGSHIFDIVKVMGLSLDGFADIIDKPRDRIGSIGRVPGLA